MLVFGTSVVVLYVSPVRGWSKAFSALYVVWNNVDCVIHFNVVSSCCFNPPSAQVQLFPCPAHSTSPL